MLKKAFPRLYYLFKNTPLYLLLIGFKNRYKDIVVRKDTTVVIEGFPRSANTFFVKLLASVWSKDETLKIAHHIHSSAQINSGVKKNVPTVLLIREPKDSISSLILYYHPNCSLDELVRLVPIYSWYYFIFHKKVLKSRDKVLIIEFNDAISNQNYFIKQVNDRFSFDLNLIQNQKEKREEVFGLIKKDYVNRNNFGEKQFSTPSNKKEIIKAKIMPSIKEDKYYLRNYNMYKFLKNVNDI